eukprot:24110-Rhodomonas_salina.1
MVPPSPVNISSPVVDEQVEDASCAPGWGDDAADAPGGGLDNSSSPGGGSPTAETASAGEKRNPFPKNSKHWGKRLSFGDKVPPLGEKPKHWRDFTLPSDFYPEDKGQWTISCNNVGLADDGDVEKGFKHNATLMCGLVIDAPNKKNVGKFIKVPMSGRYSICTAIKEAIPTARITMDIITPPLSEPPRRSLVAAFARV